MMKRLILCALCLVMAVFFVLLCSQMVRRICTFVIIMGSTIVPLCVRSENIDIEIYYAGWYNICRRENRCFHIMKEQYEHKLQQTMEDDD